MSTQFSRVYILDFFRGIASLGIIVFHVLGPYYKFFQTLYVLVDFFFVLSGYVLAKSMKVNSWQQVLLFIKKRALRIFPMALSALIFSQSIYALAVFINNSEGPSQTLLSEEHLINLLIAISLLQVFSFQSQLILFPLWSLSAEWISNIVGAIFRKIVGQVQIPLFISFGLTLFTLGTYSKILDSQSNWSVNLGRCLMCFGVGQLVQQLGEKQLLKKRITIHMVTAAACSVMYLLLVQKFEQKAIMLAPLIFGYLVWTYSAKTELFSRGRMRTISSFAGSYSYGFYVWHIPALGLCDIVLRRSNLKFSSIIILNTYEFVGTLIISTILTFLVRKYIENSSILNRK